MIQAASKNLLIGDLLFRRLSSGLWITAHSRQTAAQLIHAAELAKAFRNQELLKKIANALKEFPSMQEQNAGNYFFALALSREGRTVEALKLLEPLTISSNTHIAARALQTIATTNFTDQRIDVAARLIFKATQLIHRQLENDLVAALHNQWNWAIIHSIEGNHQRALQTLIDNSPLVRFLAQSQPHLWSLHHNSLAVELNAIGKTEEARRCINIALASPLARVYPEWAETAREIEAANPERPLLIAFRFESNRLDEEPAGDPVTSTFRLFVAAKPVLAEFVPRAIILDRIKHALRGRSPPRGGENLMPQHRHSECLHRRCSLWLSSSGKDCPHELRVPQTGGEPQVAGFEVVVGYSPADGYRWSGCDPPAAFIHPRTIIIYRIIPAGEPGVGSHGARLLSFDCP